MSMTRLSHLLYPLRYQLKHMGHTQQNLATYACRNCRRLHTENRYLKYSRATSTRANKKTIVKHVQIYPDITVKDLADQIGADTPLILSLAQILDCDVSGGEKMRLKEDVAELIVDELGYIPVKKVDTSSYALEEGMTYRPPVVTIMGHVDHGKTTLLDFLRRTSVARNEAGGITQTIGAFSVGVPDLGAHAPGNSIPDTITFVDTPGHAAFNSMRARGTQLTDMVVLVIAADDGVMVQTEECLRHINNARVPFIVAINKIDAPKADPQRVHDQLLSHGIQSECTGGEIKFVNVSALNGTNVDQLLLLLNNFAKKKRFRASLDAPVEAVVLEVESKHREGMAASVLVTNGTLTKKSVLVSPPTMCAVKQMYNSDGAVINKAFPSDPVQLLGWHALPQPGDLLTGVADRKSALKLIKMYENEKKENAKTESITRTHVRKSRKRAPSIEEKNERIRIKNYRNIADVIEEAPKDYNEVNVFLKTDLVGSLEAIIGVLCKFHHPEVKLNIVSSAVGQVTETDVQRADSIGGIVYSFNSPAPLNVTSQAEKLGVELKQFNVIYELLEDLKEEIESLLAPTVSESMIGEAEVLQVFTAKGKKVAGCRVVKGALKNPVSTDEKVVWRIKRGDKILHDGDLISLKHVKHDVKIVKQNTECGVSLERFQDFQVGDKIILLTQLITPMRVSWDL